MPDAEDECVLHRDASYEDVSRWSKVDTTLVAIASRLGEHVRSVIDARREDWRETKAATRVIVMVIAVVLLAWAAYVAAFAIRFDF